MQTRIGVEHSSPTCLIRYLLFYRCEILLPSVCGYLHMLGSLRGGVVYRGTSQHYRAVLHLRRIHQKQSFERRTQYIPITRSLMACWNPTSHKSTSAPIPSEMVTLENPHQHRTYPHCEKYNSNSTVQIKGLTGSHHITQATIRVTSVHQY